MSRKHPGQSEKYNKKKKTYFARAEEREKLKIAKNEYTERHYHMKFDEMTNPEMRKKVNHNANKTEMKKIKKFITSAQIEQIRKEISILKNNKKS